MSRVGLCTPAPPGSESGDGHTEPDSQPIGLFQLWPDTETSSSPGTEIDVEYDFIFIF